MPGPHGAKPKPHSITNLPSTTLAFAAVAALALALAAPPSHAEGRLQKVRGQMGFGYAKLLGSDTPGGSFSMGLGVDYPINTRLRAGLAFGYELLGGRVVERGSLVAGVDYSMLEILAFAHLEPRRLGPVGRVSLGTGVFSTRADLATSGGGAAFSDLAVDEVVPGFALDVTFIQKRPAPVRVGIEMGGRVALLSDDTWTMALVRLAFHY